MRTVLILRNQLGLLNTIGDHGTIGDHRTVGDHGTGPRASETPDVPKGTDCPAGDHRGPSGTGRDHQGPSGDHRGPGGPAGPERTGGRGGPAAACQLQMATGGAVFIAGEGRRAGRLVGWSAGVRGVCVCDHVLSTTPGRDGSTAPRGAG